MSLCLATGGSPRTSSWEGISASQQRARSSFRALGASASVLASDVRACDSASLRVSSRLLCYIRSCLFLTRQSEPCVFLGAACIASQQLPPLNSWLHPKNSLCPSPSVCSVPDPGALACSGSGKCAGVTLPYGAKLHAEVEGGPPASCVLSAGSVN